MSSYPTPALDLLRKVQVWQQDDTGTAAGIAVAMPGREEATLDQILAAATRPDARIDRLEAQARSWLVGYREMNPVLSRDQKAELNDVIARTAAYKVPDPDPDPAWNRPRQFGPVIPRRALIAVLALAFAIGLLIAGLVHVLGQGSTPMQSGSGQQAPAQQAPPPALTQLQQFQHDWGIPAVAQASAGNPKALVLLMNSLYYPSGWTVPADDYGWVPDPGGHVASATVQDGQVTFTDADGNSWTVAAEQPFTEASDPGTVEEFDPAGRAFTMPASHAIAIRHRI